MLVKYKTQTSWLLLVILLILASIGSSLSPAALAAPADVVTLHASQDSYTDINVPSTNFNAGLLTAANSPGLPEQGDVTTKQIFLEFSLSEVDFEIKSATLSMASLTCGSLIPVDAVNIAVYGIDNSTIWNEATLTWENQPPLSTAVLDTLDGAPTDFNSSQIYTWTDARQGDFANWLESQRLANGNTATLVLMIVNSDNPGMADIFFEDHEGTGTDYGCTDVSGQPTLLVSDVITENIFMPFINQ